MTRNSFLLTLPLLSFFKIDKIFDYEREMALLKELYFKCSFKQSATDPSVEVFIYNDACKKFFDQQSRVWRFEWIYGNCRMGRVNIPENILNGTRRITERQFNKDFSDFCIKKPVQP